MQRKEPMDVYVYLSRRERNGEQQTHASREKQTRNERRWRRAVRLGDAGKHVTRSETVQWVKETEKGENKKQRALHPHETGGITRTSCAHETPCPNTRAANRLPL